MVHPVNCSVGCRFAGDRGGDIVRYAKTPSRPAHLEAPGNLLWARNQVFAHPPASPSLREGRSKPGPVLTTGYEQKKIKNVGLGGPTERWM